MKIEALAARAARHGAPLRDRLVAAMPRYGRVASALAPLANLRNRVPALARLAERVTGLAASRRLPEWQRDRVRDDEADSDGDVLLLADTFNRYFEPENVRAAIRVLRAAGFRPSIASAGGRPLCCGRTYLSAGMVDRARAEAARTLAALAGDRPVVGLEPSCLLTLRDEFITLLPGDATRGLAGRAMLIGEFLQRHAPGPEAAAIARHGARARPLPPEGIRRISRGIGVVAAGAGSAGAADHIELLRHGGGVRLRCGDAGCVTRDGGGRVAPRGACSGCGGSHRRGRHQLPPPDC